MKLKQQQQPQTVKTTPKNKTIEKQQQQKALALNIHGRTTGRSVSV